MKISCNYLHELFMARFLVRLQLESWKINVYSLKRIANSSLSFFFFNEQTKDDLVFASYRLRQNIT